MGRASNGKKQQRQRRLADAQKLRVVVCGYPSATLTPAVELLKAAVIYADEVVLHHPTATILSSFAAISQLPNDELVDVVSSFAPALGEKGADLTRALGKLERDHGDNYKALLSGLLDPTSDLHRALMLADPSAGAAMSELAGGFALVRSDLDRVIEQQLEAADVGSLLPAIDAGILKLAPMEDREDLFESYLDALWSVLKDRAYYPLLDSEMADLVSASIREGAFEPSPQGRSRSKQVGAAAQFLRRLPTFPLATMDEVIDIRSELT